MQQYPETLTSFILRFLTGANCSNYGPLFISGNSLCYTRGKRNFITIARLKHNKLYLATMHDLFGLKLLAERLGLRIENFVPAEYNSEGFIKI